MYDTSQEQLKALNKAEMDRTGWGIYPDMSAEEYHADPCPAPSISNSQMDRILDETPLDFAYHHPRLNPDAPARKATKEMGLGDVVHQLTLGKGRGFEVLDFNDYKTKAAQTARDDAKAAGATPVLARVFEEAEVIAEVMKSAIEKTLDGAPYITEVPLMYQEMTEHGPIWVRCMIDVWCEEKRIILDPKITPMIYDDSIGRHMVNMGWDRQGALYPHAMGQIFPDLAGRIRFADIMVKPEAPFTSRVAAPEKAWEASSVRLCKIAFERFGKCMAEGVFPGFGDQVYRIPMPGWEDKRREAMGV